METKINEQIDEIIVKLQGAKSIDEIISICKEYGVNVSSEDAEKALGLLTVQEEELFLEALEDVAGGENVDTIKHWVGRIFGRG